MISISRFMEINIYIFSSDDFILPGYTTSKHSPPLRAEEKGKAVPVQAEE